MREEVVEVEFFLSFPSPPPRSSYLFRALSELLRLLLNEFFYFFGADLQPDHLGQRLLDDFVALGGGRGRRGEGAMALSSSSIVSIESLLFGWSSSKNEGSPAFTADPWPSGSQ